MIIFVVRNVQVVGVGVNDIFLRKRVSLLLAKFRVAFRCHVLQGNDTIALYDRAFVFSLKFIYLLPYSARPAYFESLHVGDVLFVLRIVHLGRWLRILQRYFRHFFVQAGEADVVVMGIYPTTLGIVRFYNVYIPAHCYTPSINAQQTVLLRVRLYLRIIVISLTFMKESLDKATM